MNNPNVTKDIKKSWLNPLRRLQSIAKGENVDGLALVKMTVLITGAGDPVIWMVKRVDKIEPKGVGVDKLLEVMSKEDLIQILEAMSD